jgi:hypothetical protein
MKNSDIDWKETGKRRVWTTRIFSVYEVDSISPTGETGTFSVLVG